MTAGADTTDAEYEREQIGAIELWRATPPSVVERAMSTLAMPVAWAVNKVIPTKAVEGALRGSNWLAGKTLGKNWAAKKAGVADEAALAGLPLRQLDEIADRFHTRAIAYATTEGGAMGALGVVGIAFDVPALITLALRTIRGIGSAYGYDAEDEAEREFALAILSAAGSSSLTEKTAALATLQSIKVTAGRVTFKKMAEAAASRPLSNEAAIIAIKTLAKQLGVNITKRKLAQAVPVIGGAVGMAVNAAFIGDVGWAARRAYQARLLTDRGHTIAG